MKLLFALVVLCISGALATDFDTCPDGIQSPISVEVNGCDSPPCRFVKGTDVIASVIFETPVDVDSFTPKVKAKVGPIDVDFPIEKPGCDSLIDGSCPLEQGEIVTYQLQLPIRKEYPPLDLEIKLTLVDDATEDPMACFRVRGRVVEP